MICLSLDTTNITSGRGSSSTSKEVSVAETAADLLKQSERQEPPSFVALLHFSLLRLNSKGGKVVNAEAAPSHLPGPAAAHLSTDSRGAQQQLAAAVNASPEEAAERLLPLASRLAELLHSDLRLNACMRLQSTHQDTKEGEPGAEAATAAAASSTPDASLPLKKLRLTSKEDLGVAARGTGLGADDMRLFAVLLLPLLVAKHSDEAVSASMRCTFCRCWMGLLRWQQQHQLQAGRQGASLLPLLSLQVPLLVSSVLFAPLGSSFAAASVAAGPATAKKRGAARHAVQQTREDARRAAADLVRSFAAALQQQQQQQKEPKMLRASGHEPLLEAFLPVLSGSSFGVQQLRKLKIFAAEPPSPQQQQHQQTPNDALYVQLKEAMNQHQELSLQTEEKQKQEVQRLPTPGELAGSLVVVGCVFSAGENDMTNSSSSDNTDRNITVQAVSAVLKHFCFWATAYCGEDCVRAAFPLQQQHQGQMDAFGAYAQPWADALLLCSLEALSRALRGHWPSVLVAVLSLDGTQQQQEQEEKEQEEQQRGNRGVVSMEALLALLTTISKTSLSRCVAPETGLLLPAASMFVTL